jgi:hypothetical protein
MSYTEKIRRLTKLVPNLVKASYIKQAYDLEKFIKASFEIPSDLNALLGGMPANHREEFIRQYKNALYEAYDCGMKCMKPEMEFSKYQDIFNGFLESVKAYVSHMGTNSKILEMVEKDIKSNYSLGVEEATKMNQNNKLPKLEDVSKGAEASVETAKSKEVIAEENKPMPKSLEDYAKLLGPGIPEKVLRTYLGLKTATASADASDEDLVEKIDESMEMEPSENSENSEELEMEESVDSMCGPFKVAELKEALLQKIGSHSVDESLSEQSIVVDCVVNLEGKSEQENAEAISKALQLDPIENGYSIEEAMMGADMVAEELTHCMGLPGNFMFLDVENEYCLVYLYPTETALQHSKLANKVVTAAKKSLGHDIPDGPQGALELKDQKEIEAVCKLNSLRGMSMKDLKEKAPKIHTFIKNAMSELSSSMVTLGEALNDMSLSVSGVVGKVYGKDGVAYLMHCQNEAKAAKAAKKRKM